MANWCNNVVAFSGEKENVAAFKTELKKLYEEYEKFDLGIIPEDYSGDGRPMFLDDGLHNLDEDVFGFQTKYAPTEDLISFFGKKYKLDIEYYYEELGSYIYGVFYYDSKTDSNYSVDLEESDWSKIKQKDDGNFFIFENEEWESEVEILETLLDRKIRNYEKQD